MQLVKRLLLCSTLTLLVVATMNAQDGAASSATVVVPRLVNFSGSAFNDQGKPVTGIVGLTFSIYNAQEGGAPLWLETQNVQADGKGNYTVQLGATTSQGLPLDVFTSGEARWLGVRVNGGEEQPRVLLLSVPYALKAADAQTLGGLPASAFALATPAASNAPVPAELAPSSSAGPSANIGGSGTEDYIPLWTDNNGDLGNSILYQLGSGSSAKIGINEKNPLFTLDVNGEELVRGLFEMATQNYASKTKGYDSQPLNLESSAFNSGTGTYTLNHFQWQAEPVGNNTTSPGATLNLLYGTDPTSPAETGLKLSSTGIFTFASGQTFPGTGTITGVTTASGSGLSGGGTSGGLNLSLVNTCATNQVLQWSGSAWACSSAGTGTITGVTAGTDLTGGGTSGNVTVNVDTSKVPQLAANNTFTQNNVFEPFNTDAIDAYTAWPGKSALVGIEYATSGGSYGVYAITYDSSGAGVAGIEKASGGVGVYGAAPTGYGIYAASGEPAAYLQGTTEDGQGVGPGDGVYSVGGNSENFNGGQGGVFGGGNGNVSYNGGDGIVAVAGYPENNTYAGTFLGSVEVTGNLSKGGGSFKIDHPLDPANKYLYHSFVESPDMKNIYDGVATLDGNGEAVIQMPDWFGVLNRDFRYQLTPIGSPGPNLYVAQELSNGHFKIAGGQSGGKVSWQITGIRQDAWANAHRIPVEEEKDARLKGFYIHPELYGAPPEKQIEWARHPQTMKQLQESKQKMQVRKPTPSAALTHGSTK
jgi:hypothetical protein